MAEEKVLTVLRHAETGVMHFEGGGPAINQEIWATTEAEKGKHILLSEPPKGTIPADTSLSVQ